jgi:hypothetical protein
LLDKTTILERSRKLDAIAQTLKAHFIGIDEVIDDLISYVRVWYVAPEVLRRPVIINLWGMTGVGKTDLVRRLVAGLGLTSRFVEIELSNIDQSGWSNTVSNIFDSFGFHDGKPAIVLFDEIQRFNTIHPNGEPIDQTKYMDFWELLSDGRLSRKMRNSYLENTLNNIRMRKVDLEIQRRRAQDDHTRAMLDEQLASPIGTYEAQNILNALPNLDRSIEDLGGLTFADAIDLLELVRKREDLHVPIDHSRTLIIISGNLDQAFTMAGQTAEADIDADVFHAFTKKISVVDVKNALSSKFRPEQVARFGNTHVIYNSLRRMHFETLIAREVERVIEQTKLLFGIELTVDPAIAALIYRNGVFPVQGVRPVFSTVMDILEASLSPLIIDAVMKDQNRISLSYDTAREEMSATIGAETKRWIYKGRVDRIRSESSEDAITNVSVHEAGHAVAHVVLLGVAPIQMKSRLASSYAAGFTFAHDVYRTRASMISTVKILLAGGLAEELVFGGGNASIGRASDREQATMLVLDFIRRFGFDDEFQACYALDGPAYSINTSPTDLDAEKLMARLVAETRELLGRHQPFLMALSGALLSSGELDGAAIQSVSKQFGLNCAVQPEGFQIIPDYAAALTAPRRDN